MLLKSSLATFVAIHLSYKVVCMYSDTKIKYKHFLNALGTFNIVYLFYHFNWIRSAFYFWHFSVDIVYIYFLIKSLMIYFDTINI